MLLRKESLTKSKNLLAFSAGVDSTALLFLLLENKIKFDIAIVDYGLRLQSKEEVKYAQELALKYNFTCHLLNAETITSNFEANARTLRYNFFEKLIAQHKYENLLTAHHLGDRFEWMLMQFCKGAGCAELSGMSESEKRSNYTLIRPLLHLDKQELLSYLNAGKMTYFIDESNEDSKYKRNEFRHKFSNPLLQKHLSGIKKSFKYIDEDVKTLILECEVLESKELSYFKSSSSKRSDIFYIDKILKSKGILISANEREQLKESVALVVGRKYIVNQEHGFVFVAPYIKVDKIPKELKERLRLLHVEPKLRGYLASDVETLELVSLVLA